MQHYVVSLSGGMDSSTLLLNCLDQVAGDSLFPPSGTVTAVSFDYGQKHRVELERAASLVQYLRDSGLTLNYEVIKLEGLSGLLHSTLVEGGAEVPEGHYADEIMQQTVVPNRNKIFSSIVQSIALSIANKTNESVFVALGIHAGDHAIYPDCRQLFRDADNIAFQLGNWGRIDKVSYYTPYLDLTKTDILLEGEWLCSEHNLDFDTFYSNTNTSYKPIQIDSKWYSDYKSSSSVERVEAFIAVDMVDPLEYADETGPVSWDVVKAKVEAVLKEREDF
jgi:7-cyano-7-deazaguanine synthase